MESMEYLVETPGQNTRIPFVRYRNAGTEGASEPSKPL
jgi:hypothetical protein